jgi:hypothetical protein
MLQTYEGILKDDHIEWQRRTRTDRSLPGREE